MLEVKSKTDGSEIIKSNDYARFLSNLKEKVRTSQQKAIVQVNQLLILLYHHIGSEILRLQKEKGWGSKVIDQLSKDLKSSFPEMKGFSLSNLKYMKQFAESFTEQQISQQAAGQLPWFHLVTIISSIKDFETQSFYIQKTIENGWSRGHLLEQIKAGLHKRSGKAITNFQTNLPAPFSDLAEQSLKDPYLFDFLTVGREAHEKAIENAIIEHIEKFLLELGTGFAFVGRQYKLTVSDKSYYIDLLFYHLKLRSFVVVEIKANEFKPSHIGQVNFYLSAVDDLLRHPTDNPTIGLILCEHKDNVTAEYALKDINKPIGISEYQLSKSIPENLRDLLPSVDDIEAQLNREQISKEVSK